MMVIPAGSIMLGTRDHPDAQINRVTISASFAVGKYDVTRDEFAAFVSATGYRVDGCYTYDGGKPPGALFHNDPRADWRQVGFDQSGRAPVVCVNWSDAKAYAAWLSQKTGRQYRLLSEEEWQYAARGGAKSVYGWDAKIVHEHANIGSDYCCRPEAHGRDRWLYTSPVGSFDPNPYGLYDMLGNVEQWTETCSTLSHEGVATCAERVLRGSNWSLPTGYAHDTAARSVGDPTVRESSIGFRVAGAL
jgi:formylglycine-generating enzyme required for sulfatase activity